MSLSHGKTLVTEGYGRQQCDLPPFEEGRIDPREWFAAPGRPLEIEIGSGKGTFLVQQAPLRAAVNYLGLEKSLEFYRYAADRVRRRGLDNVRLLRTDAAEFLRFWCGDGVAAAVHLYFADPWPKKRHHKRRIIQDWVLGDLHRILGPAGELRLVTDHEELWAWYVQCAHRHAHLFEPRPFEPPDSAAPGEIVGSNFERKYRREGRPLYAMTLVKKSDEATERRSDEGVARRTR
ncbi:MAG: tRNA (guanosine(46)-N7)-methyltransferase TrmB [Myxococcota bacterium]